MSAIGHWSSSREEGRTGKKLIDWEEWQHENSSQLYRCEGCRDIYARRDPPQEPPCETCRVDLDPENHVVARIYSAVKGQVITVGEANIPVDLNHLAVWKMIEKYKVKDETECFERVMGLFYHVLSQRNYR